MKSLTPIEMLLAYANRLRFRNLFLLTLALFVIDLIIPDMIPLIDEIVLGLLTILFSSWKKEKEQNRKDGDIEGGVKDDGKHDPPIT